MTQQDTAILVAVGTTKNSEETNEHLDELAFLAETVGINTIKRLIQNLPSPDSRTFIGKGKLAELKEYVIARQVKRVIFDDDLTPSQLRNLERELNPK